MCQRLRKPLSSYLSDPNVTREFSFVLRCEHVSQHRKGTLLAEYGVISNAKNRSHAIFRLYLYINNIIGTPWARQRLNKLNVTINNTNTYCLWYILMILMNIYM